VTARVGGAGMKDAGFKIATCAGIGRIGPSASYGGEHH